MRGPGISQQQIGAQVSTLKHAPRESLQSVSLEQKCEDKCSKTKRVLTCAQKTCLTVDAITCDPSCSSIYAAQLTYEKTKFCAKARKRKDRQESVTSIYQDRKVIRSNSEERPTNYTNNIRRVSSNEDFNKSNNMEDLQSSQALGQKKDNFIELEYEYEKQRNSERFSRPLVPRNTFNSQIRRPRSKQYGKNENLKRNNRSEIEHFNANSSFSKENDMVCQFLQLHQTEEERSASPICIAISPALDLNTLHQQIDCTEPLPSTVTRQISSENERLTILSMTSDTLLSSPRNSVISKQRIYLNQNIPQTITDARIETKDTLEHCQKTAAKHINRLKKKMKKYDEDFLAHSGYMQPYNDKLNNKEVKKLYGEFYKLKREHTQLFQGMPNVYILEEFDRTRPILRDTLQDIEKKLDSKRLLAGRNKIIDEMTNEQLIEEKIAVQKALLYLESQYGRPSLKEDKDLARPLYDRYRLLKRLVAKINMTNNSMELATIHEHEAMHFVTIPQIHKLSNNQKLSNWCEKMRPNDQQLAPFSLSTSTTDSSDTDTSIGENLHALTLEKLYEQQQNTNEEKKQLRRTLKEFEFDFEEKMGRRAQREDKIIMEEVYQSYKNTKAKLKLLDALVRKQSL